jgi:hypothetical protein
MEKSKTSKSTAPKSTSPLDSVKQKLNLPKGITGYVGLIALFTFLIFLFSMFMSVVAAERSNIYAKNFGETETLYRGELSQAAPYLDNVSKDYIVENKLAAQLGLSESDLKLEPKQFQERLRGITTNINIIKTAAEVNIDAEYIKKGLNFQPTFSTQFKADYVLKSSVNEVSVVSFQFPFPRNLAEGEMSNVTLVVNGVAVENAKTVISQDQYGAQAQGLKWEGKLGPNETVNISVSYATVGTSRFIYEGLENKIGQQDFDMVMHINGTRAYDLNSGLTITERKFGDNNVTLIWSKKNLYNTPSINVDVADKFMPSQQVSRIYVIMAPIYLVFMSILVWLGLRNNRRLQVKDFLFTTALFAIYFPLLHYVASFTIDPTIQVFSGINNIPQFSMPLYGAFAISLLIVGGLIIYLYQAVYSLKFALKNVAPTLLMMLGFFPLVVTVPEYSVLMMIIGLIAMLLIFIKSRLDHSHNN